MTTAQNRTEPPVNRRLGFEAAPYHIQRHYFLFEFVIFPNNTVNNVLKLCVFRGNIDSNLKRYKIMEQPTLPHADNTIHCNSIVYSLKHVHVQRV